MRNEDVQKGKDIWLNQKNMMHETLVDTAILE